MKAHFGFSYHLPRESIKEALLACTTCHLLLVLFIKNILFKHQSVCTGASTKISPLRVDCNLVNLHYGPFCDNRNRDILIVTAESVLYD